MRRLQKLVVEISVTLEQNHIYLLRCYVYNAVDESVSTSDVRISAIQKTKGKTDTIKRISGTASTELF